MWWWECVFLRSTFIIVIVVNVVVTVVAVRVVVPWLDRGETQEELNRAMGRDLVCWICFSILWRQWTGVLADVGAVW